MKKTANTSDGFFENVGDWHSNACVNFMADPSNGYAWGYKEAADCLVQNVVEMNKQDTFIYPIVFLYRHYLELRLKIIIHKGGQLLDKDGGFPMHHKVITLWGEARAIIRQIWKDAVKDPQLKLTGDLIQKFCEIDPNSEAFRYPIDKNLQKTLSTIEHINIDELAKVMGEASIFLESVSLNIAEYLKNKQEWEAAMENAYGMADIKIE